MRFEAFFIAVKNRVQIAVDEGDTHLTNHGYFDHEKTQIPQ